MRAKLTSYKLEKDRLGRPLYHFFFDSLGPSGTYDCYTGPAFFNFRRWQPLLRLLDDKVEIWLDNLVVKNQKKHLISADSAFFYYRTVYPPFYKNNIV